jgi:hypothetical protein
VSKRPDGNKLCGMKHGSGVPDPREAIRYLVSLNLDVGMPLGAVARLLLLRTVPEGGSKPSLTVGLLPRTPIDRSVQTPPTVWVRIRAIQFLSGCRDFRPRSRNSVQVSDWLGLFDTHENANLTKTLTIRTQGFSKPRGLLLA